jgi:hypothetical protein
VFYQFCNKKKRKKSQNASIDRDFNHEPHIIKTSELTIHRFPTELPIADKSFEIAINKCVKVVFLLIVFIDSGSTK